MPVRENIKEKNCGMGDAPLIGIPVCGVEQGRQFVTDAYVHAVAASGGIPLLIPYLREEDAALTDRADTSPVDGDDMSPGNRDNASPGNRDNESPENRDSASPEDRDGTPPRTESRIALYVNLCDGFLFPGGGDIDPLLFGQKRRPSCGDTDILFDRFQVEMIRRVMEMGKPLLAICRGMQVLNVACGGSLYQDLALRGRYVREHMQKTEFRSEPTHRIWLFGGRLRRWFGSFVDTNSYHHQAVDAIGERLYVRGLSPDGVVEALEGARGFVLGVQWHPEAMYDTSGRMRHIFTEFIDAAREEKIRFRMSDSDPTPCFFGKKQERQEEERER